MTVQMIKFLAGLIPGIIVILIGFFVLTYNPRNRMNRFFFYAIVIFGIYSICISSKNLINYLVTIGNLNLDQGLIYQTLRSKAGGFLTPIFGALFLNFCVLFPDNKKTKWNLRLFFVSFIISALVGSIALTDIWVVDRRFYIDNSIYHYTSTETFWYYFISFWTMAFVISGLVILMVKYKRVKYKQYKAQIGLLGMGMFMTTLIAGLAEMVGSDYGLSFLTGVGSLFLSVSAAIAIVKHRLLDIRSLLQKSMMWIVIYLLVWIPLIPLVYLFTGWFGDIPPLWQSLMITMIFFLFFQFYKLIKRKVDLLFHSTQYKIYQKMEEFIKQVVITRDTKQIAERTGDFLDKTLHPNNICFYSLASPFLSSRQKFQYQCLWFNGVENPPPMNRNIFIHYLEDHPNILLKEDLLLYQDFQKISEYGVNTMEQMESVLILPLVGSNRFLGFISLGERKNGQIYSDNDIKFLEVIRTQLSVALSNALYIQQMEMKKKIDNDLILAMELQKHLLPSDLPVTRTLRSEVLYLPARGIGGDYYDMIPLFNEKLFITMADVSGKGISAGLITVMIRTMIHTEVKAGQQYVNINKIVSNINDLLVNALSEDKYSTLITIIYDSPTRKLQIVNAGHLPLVVYRPAEDEVLQYGSDDLPLGIIPNYDFHIHEVQLLPNDIGIIYTDGITEASDESDNEYGLERLMNTIRKTSDQDPEVINAAILQDLDDFIGDKQFHDDLTLIIFKIS